MAELVDLPDIHANDYRMYRVTVTNETGGVIDVSGDKFWFTMKADPESQDDASADYQVEITAPADAESQAGKAYLPAVLNGTGVVAGTYQYDVQWQRLASGAGANDINTVIYGKIKVLQEVTRDTT